MRSPVLDEPATTFDRLLKDRKTLPCGHAQGTPQVRLWDGKDYCQDCVERLCPGLSDYARAHDVLEDEMPPDKPGRLKTWWRIVGLLTLVPVLASAGLLVGLGLQATALIFGLMLICIIPGALLLLASVQMAPRILPRVRLVDGRVEVYRPLHHKGQTPMVSYALADAHWREGWFQEESFCRGRGGAIVARQRVVLLQAPERWKGVRPQSEYTATGSSPEMLARWKAFLKLAEIPTGKPPSALMEVRV